MPGVRRSERIRNRQAERVSVAGAAGNNNVVRRAGRSGRGGRGRGPRLTSNAVMRSVANGGVANEDSQLLFRPAASEPGRRSVRYALEVLRLNQRAQNAVGARAGEGAGQVTAGSNGNRESAVVLDTIIDHLEQAIRDRSVDAMMPGQGTSSALLDLPRQAISRSNLAMFSRYTGFMPASEASRSTAARRLGHELAEFKRDPLENCTVDLYENDMFHWKATIPGPPDTPYENGTFILDLYFPGNYPFQPPQVYFLTKIYHCNISSSGYICMDVLTMRWSPALTAAKVLLSIMSLLADANPNDPLDASIALLYNRDRSQHDKNARTWTTLYATRQPSDISIPRQAIDASPGSSSTTASTEAIEAAPDPASAGGAVSSNVDIPSTSTNAIDSNTDAGGSEAVTESTGPMITES